MKRCTVQGLKYPYKQTSIIEQNYRTEIWYYCIMEQKNGVTSIECHLTFALVKRFSVHCLGFLATRILD